MRSMPRMKKRKYSPKVGTSRRKRLKERKHLAKPRHRPSTPNPAATRMLASSAGHAVAAVAGFAVVPTVADNPAAAMTAPVMNVAAMNVAAKTVQAKNAVDATATG